MSKLTLLTVAAFFSTLAGAWAETYNVDSWPGDIDNIPCSAWQKSADGTWVLAGNVKIGASVLTNIGVKGDAAARTLDKKCGKK